MTANLAQVADLPRDTTVASTDLVATVTPSTGVVHSVTTSDLVGDVLGSATVASSTTTTAAITTANITTGNITTIANCTTAGITTGNITTGNITTGNINKLVSDDAGELVIATGAVTVTGSFHTVDTESDAASDDLDTINGGADGQFLILMAEDGTRSVVVKDGTGNIQCAGDCTLDNEQDTITLIYAGVLNAWVELARSNNGA